MTKKEKTKHRYEVNEGNPDRVSRIEALFEGKVIKVSTYRHVYYKLDKYKRLTFSNTGHKDSFQPYLAAFNYGKVLDDYEESSGMTKKIEII